MNASIITIGDEILLGQTLDSNSQWISNNLTILGIHVIEIITISDERQQILKSLKRIAVDSDLVFITGGLGPTNDDITKKVLAEFTGSELEFRDDIFEKVKAYFADRDKELVEKNRSQAVLPSNCEAIENKKGTASGMWIRTEETTFISMPGVPYEMKAMMRSSILKMISDRFDIPKIVFKHILTAAIPEAILSDRLQSFEKELPEHIRLAYLPNLGKVKLRLTARGDDRKQLKSEISKQVEKVLKIVGDSVYGYDGDTLSGKIGEYLSEQGKMLATAESCTGGYIAHEITSVAGSSKYFCGSVVAYSNEIKMKLLQVNESTLEKYGAVSEQTVEEMVKGVISLTGADYGIAVSGIAGPDGGTEEKPVGTVCFSLGDKNSLYTRRVQLLKDREMNIKLTSSVALESLRKFLIKQLELHPK